MLLAMSALAACSSSHRPEARSDATKRVTQPTLLSSDTWRLPAVSGPPSTQNFCAVLTSVYRHEADIPHATIATKVAIVTDFVDSVPEMIATAPPSIAPAAKTYFVAAGKALGALADAGLDYKKVPPGTFSALLLDPSIKAAGNSVLAFSQQQCHYTIGGA